MTSSEDTVELLRLMLNHQSEVTIVADHVIDLEVLFKDYKFTFFIDSGHLDYLDSLTIQSTKEMVGGFDYWDDNPPYLNPIDHLTTKEYCDLERFLKFIAPRSVYGDLS